MIDMLTIVLMTKNLEPQKQFYENVLGLELLFEFDDSVGLGFDSTPCIIIKYDDNPHSHHLKENKGPLIITLSSDVKNKPTLLQKIEDGGFTIRSKLDLPKHGREYYFIEDVDGNEICLDFKI